ncbi:MAG: penicillin-binding protein 2 [Bacteroidales bacterium]|nr:penicillin-binding protein 2 [Bacteroidales bacterium]
MDLGRKEKLTIGLVVAAAILLIRLFSIQISDDKYRKESERNAMVYEDIFPTRGVIYDRNGRILVGNKVAYDILVSPKELSKLNYLDTVALANVLDTTVDFVRGRLKYYHTYRTRLGNQSQVMIKQISPENYTRFEEHAYMFPAFKGQMRSIRDYPFNAGGNLLGYVSEVDANDLKKHPGEYRSGDYIGKTGIEAAREEDLRGKKGCHIYLRDATNTVQAPYENGMYDQEAVPGNDIITTIDAELQQYGQELMRNKVGSVVAIEPKTGEILAMVSSPGIDVEQLADIRLHYNEIVNDPYKPMLNRTVQGYYPPGSVFKLVNGLIGLEEGVLQPEDRHPCYAGYQYAAGRKLGCHSHSSPLNLLDAIATSCNAYFCYVFRDILENKKFASIQDAFDHWRDYVLSFGFGRKLESDFPAELSGSIPTSSRYNKIYGRRGWKFQTIISLSIGQGEILATPLQLANLCATVANRGWYRIPHIVKDSKDVRIDDKYREKQYTMVDTLQFKKVIKGMYWAVNGGGSAGQTGRIAAIPGLDVCGKTGTAQNPHGKDNSVFICFAPMDDPQIAIAAYVENAGFGATWAGPIASLMMELYFNGEISPERQYLEDRVFGANLMPPLKKQ